MRRKSMQVLAGSSLHSHGISAVAWSFLLDASSALSSMQFEGLSTVIILQRQDSGCSSFKGCLKLCHVFF